LIHKKSRELTKFFVTYYKCFICAPSVTRHTPGELLHRWIGRVGKDDFALFAWPPRSPDLTPCDFFLCGYVKDRVCVPPLPATLVELLERISAAVTTIDMGMLQKVCTELDYRLDVCRVTNGAT
jgi:hypothetical protein